MNIQRLANKSLIVWKLSAIDQAKIQGNFPLSLLVGAEEVILQFGSLWRAFLILIKLDIDAVDFFYGYNYFSKVITK